MSAVGRESAVRRPLLPAVATALAASALPIVLMLWARSALQLRTLPERLMETFLLVIPPDQFEAAIEKYGPMAKDYALFGTNLAMFLGLFALGLFALRRGLPMAALLVLGAALWLVAVLVIFPITGAGLFATGLLLQSPILVNAVYLGMGLAYATVLIAGQIFIGRPSPAETTRVEASTSRRALVAGLGGSLAAFLVTLWFGRSAGAVVSTLPMAEVPENAASPSPQAAAAATPVLTSAAPVSTAAATPTPDPYPEPPPERELPRDKDGALLAVNRPRGQLQTLVTQNADFYTVTKNAGGDPILSAMDWRLIIDGAVNRPVQLDYPGLRKLHQVRFYKALECISNLTSMCELTAFGCDLISTAEWTGARLADVITLAGGLQPGVMAIAAIGADEFSSSLPAEAATDPDVILAYEMNGQILPREHGFPVRLIIPGRYGLKNAKWVVRLQPMTQPYVDWYGQRNWNLMGIVKTMARIDEPVNGATLQAGSNGTSGVAYAGDRGVARVEYSADGGTNWQDASFVEPPLGKDTFVRWRGMFAIAAGQRVSLVVRATDGTGQLQQEEFSLPQPDGGSGWDGIEVSAA
jgi:DMSO/TMAO reductase YedYZ molybdopterin-dependent catalytic subunit